MDIGRLLSQLSGHSKIVLELDLARGLIEHRPENPIKALRAVNATTMSALRIKLDQAAADDRVAGLIVHAVGGHHPMALLEEVGDLIAEFGKHKPTLAWAETFGEAGPPLASFAMACAADQVWLQPTGQLPLLGAELQINLLKGLLRNVSIEPQFGQRKEYKTAADQFAADEVTPAHREMITQVGQSLVDELVARIAARRSLTAEQVWEALNSGPLTPEQALERGLIDEVGYRDQAYTRAMELWDTEPEQLLFAGRYAPPLLKQRPSSRGPKLAHVPLRGPIVTGRGTPPGPQAPDAGSDVVDEHLRAALRDDDIVAVIFSVDSPGGSAVASDFIRRSVLQLRAAGKPVVAQMGDVAASGGYYVSMPCDRIVTKASTLTGSIGVVAGKFVTQKLVERIGVKREVIRIGQHAGWLSDATEFSEEEWQLLNDDLDRIYHQFTSFAAEDRGMSLAELEPLARGRVWTGADAVRNGLADQVGGWREARQLACELAGVDPDRVGVQQIGRQGLLASLRPARSSETVSDWQDLGVSYGSQLERLVATGADVLGLRGVTGPLAMPWVKVNV